MRVISQDGTIDIPYELSAVTIGNKGDLSEFNINIRSKLLDERPCIVATYSTETKAQKAMEMLRTAYAGKFVTNADISEDFNERLKELMKGGFGTVLVKETNDCRVEFNNLNGYFQFPADEDVEV